MTGFLSGCRDVGGGESLESRLTEQSEELAGVRRALDRSRVNLNKVREWQDEQDEIARIKADWELGAEKAKVLEDQLAELQGEEAVSRRELKKLQAARRAKVRANWVGQTIDLSATKGEGYEQVRVFEVLPTGIKILLSTGTETVSLEDVPDHIRELFLMTEEEAAAYRKRLEDSARERADRYARFKKQQKKRPSDRAEEAARERLAEVQKRVDEIEGKIRERMAGIRDLKSTASAWELKSAKSIGTKKRSRAIRYALAYREKAQEIADGNARAREVVAVLREELIDLEKSLRSPAGGDSGR